MRRAAHLRQRRGLLAWRLPARGLSGGRSGRFLCEKCIMITKKNNTYSTIIKEYFLTKELDFPMREEHSPEEE